MSLSTIVRAFLTNRVSLFPIEKRAMNLISFICILIGVSLNACAQLLLKAGVNAVGHFDLTAANILPVGFKIATQLPIIGGLACYVLSVVVWIVGLSRVDVSIAYPMLSLGYVVNVFAAWYLFGEALSMQRLVGIGIILVGIVVLARG
ncbi:MAG: Undecaprenyl phosphate-aminoarabinose flippase subunit ArnE @ Undecaprenyl phosphate-aminoarabinose flippase subunit ArnF [uncultured Caballeronia sp.]|nr:MAG: Undecaprenyl phosphate-aminoarabinose flippase subunit ArnE @ Undecaprenyl phosphate-aminoarabinose flippase subunit ArnF [uncultured Caballeronia sp.]